MSDQNQQKAPDISDLHSGLVYDAYLDVAGVDGAMTNGPCPVHGTERIWGEAFVVQGGEASAASAHQTLLAWTSMLANAGLGQILVIATRDRVPRALMGELSSEALKLSGVVGTIVDAGVRDTRGIRERGIPTFARFRTPRDVVAAWLPDANTDSVTVGGQTIRQGDFIFADEDGIIVVNADYKEQTLERAFEMYQTESLVQVAIRDGVPADTAYLRYGKF